MFCRPALRDRRLLTDFHFQPGVAAFVRRPHSSIFPKNCGGLPAAATTSSELPVISERRRRGIYVESRTKIHLQPHRGDILKMSLLTELGNLFVRVFYKDAAPTALKLLGCNSGNFIPSTRRFANT